MVRKGLNYICKCLPSHLAPYSPLSDRIIISDEEDVVDNECTAKLSGAGRLTKKIELIATLLDIAATFILSKMEASLKKNGSLLLLKEQE